jgi:hypothetical protein
MFAKSRLKIGLCGIGGDSSESFLQARSMFDVYAGEDGARCRFRTCDPFRVKEVLYH